VVSRRRWLPLALVLAVLVAASLMLAFARPAPDGARQVSSLGMFSGGKWTKHYRVPNEAQVELILADEGIPLKGAEARAKAVDAFRQARIPVYGAGPMTVDAAVDALVRGELPRLDGD